MIIEISRISAAGSVYRGSCPPAIMDLEGDRFIRVTRPIHYEIRVEIVSDQVLVQGTVETELDLMCVACAEFFSTTVRVSSFLRAYPIQSGLERIDLGPDFREELLLAVPPYPRGAVDEHDRCTVCQRVVKALFDPGASGTGPGGVWDSLDGLKW
jgi:hypothetical protein